MTDTSADEDPPDCFRCGGSTVPVSMPSGIVVGGYCGDCHAFTGMRRGYTAL